MTRVPTPVLHLLHDAPEAESPAQHIRNAIQALVLADARLAEWLPACDQQLVEWIRSAEARCFRDLFQLGQEAP